jgi:HK97 gp10 family phage protein
VARPPEVNSAALNRALRYNPEVVEATRKMGNGIAGDAKHNAEALGLIETGGGIKSIHAEVGFDSDGVFARVSWDRRHFYMQFHELGTSHENAKPFLRPAAEKERAL